MPTQIAERIDDRTKEGAELTVTNAVWIATALLHQRHPERREGFTAEEIVRMVVDCKLTGAKETSIRQHVNQHCVANRKPQPNRACILFDLGDGRRRLFRVGDPVTPGRDSTHTHPRWEELPAEYSYLRGWYEAWQPGRAAQKQTDPLLELIGSGVSIWKEQHADEYVASLRKNWGDTR